MTSSKVLMAVTVLNGPYPQNLWISINISQITGIADSCLFRYVMDKFQLTKGNGISRSYTQGYEVKHTR